MRRRPKPLRPDRVRHLETPFGWTPLRMLTSGLLAELSTEAKLLTFFLSLVSDRQGLSFWGDERVSEQMGLSFGELSKGRAELCQRDLLAYNGWLYQLLPLPDWVVPKAPGPARGSRSSSRPRSSVPRAEEASAEAVGEILRRMQRRDWGDAEE